MVSPSWYQLDNVGKFYASQAGSTRQTVFRITATMKDAIDETALQRALDQTVERFPGFNVCLRSGLFWHYLEPASQTPRVQPETLPPCSPLHHDRSSTLFRVLWYKNRFHVEVSHIISDGRGSLEFFKALLEAYVAECSHAPALLPRQNSKPQAAHTENSFSENYDPSAAGSTPQPRVFHLSGWKSKAVPTYMELHFPADVVYRHAKNAGVSVTSYLTAAVIASLRTEVPENERHRTIRLDVPVDLRELFSSTTLRNFFGLAFVEYVPGDIDEPLTRIAACVHRQLIEGTKPDTLKRRAMQMVKLEKHPILRFTPLVVKDFALDLAERKAAREVTSTVSSLGRITVSEKVAPYLQSISVLTTPATLNFVACTYGNDLVVGISSRLINHRIERHFVRLLAAEGITGYMTLNKTRTEVDEALTEAHLEDRLKAMSSSWLKRPPNTLTRESQEIRRQ